MSHNSIATSLRDILYAALKTLVECLIFLPQCTQDLQDEWSSPFLKQSLLAAPQDDWPRGDARREDCHD